MRRESEMEEKKGERGEGWKEIGWAKREREGGEMWIYEKRKREWKRSWEREEKGKRYRLS
jgi:hypothetical protein